MGSLQEVKIHVAADADADPEELERLSGRLRGELKELDVQSIDEVDAGPPPPGAKGDAVALGSLALTLAPVVIPPLINLLQSWLTRHDRASLTLEGKNGDKLSITGNPTREQEQVISSWLSRQQA